MSNHEVFNKYKLTILFIQNNIPGLHTYISSEKKYLLTIDLLINL